VTHAPPTACQCCGAIAVRIRAPGPAKGHWGWARIIDGALERGTTHHPDAQAAISALRLASIRS